MYRRRRQSNTIDPNIKGAAVDRSSDVSQDEGEKVLNTGSSIDVFLNVCDVFEKVLDDVKIDNCCKEVHEKLLKIHRAIQKKLEHSKVTLDFGLDLPDSDLNSSRSLASSMLSLCSVSSVATQNLEDDSTFKQYLSRVNCPFCSELQADKTNLISHLDTCKPLINKTFQELNFMPYSVFQILPNNTFKCNVCPHSVQRNIKANFIHAKTNQHVSAYKKLAKKKPFTEDFFCSSCKVLVPNNFTQFDIHINHQIHKSRSGQSLRAEDYIQKGVHCLYQKNKKFKCLICPSQFYFYSVKDFIAHFDDHEHVKASKRKHMSLGMTFCEYCSEEINIFHLIKHFNSDAHKFQEKTADIPETFELCLYCGVTCKNLKELAAHMTSKCDEINEMKKVMKKTEKFDTIAKQIPKNKKKIPEDNLQKQDVIVIKDNTELPALFTYFKKFGEVTAIDLINGKHALIQFQEKTVVDNILQIRNAIKLNGVPLEIASYKELKSEKVVEPKKQTKERRVSFRHTDVPDLGGEKKDKSDDDDDNENGDDDDDDDDVPVNDLPTVETRNERLRELFERVSTHLSNSTQMVDSEILKNILQDCDITFGKQNYIVVGFTGTGLSFSVEDISLYYTNKTSLRFLYLKMSDLVLWENVTLNEYDALDCVKATHRATQITCKINNSQYTKILTDILRYYQKKNAVVKPFCLMIRFWLSVHELKIKEYEYVVISLLIFFLLNKGVVEEYPNIEKEVSSKAFIFSKAVNDIQKVNQVTTKIENKVYGVQELFQKFLSFLVGFDFNKHSICVPVHQPIPREWTQHKQALTDCPMLIWDPLVRVNLSEKISEDDLKTLLLTAESTLSLGK